MYQGKYAQKSQKRPKSPKKQGPRLGSVIFYTLFFAGIFLFYAATYLGLLELRGWLVRYENAQPSRKSQEVFQQLFADPDWGTLYDTAGMEDTVYESRDTFVSCMEDRVGSSSLTCMETSAGLSGDKKYVICLGAEKIASFTLVDQNKNTGLSALPDWQLEKIEFFFRRTESFLVQKQETHTAYVNGIPLDNTSTIRIGSTKAETYLPTGVSAPRTCTQQVAGLLTTPSVTILDEAGAEMLVVYDEATHTFTEQPPESTISEEEKATALNAVKTYALYMIAKAGDADISKYFKRSSDAYRAITSTELGYVQDAQRREFVNETLSDYCRYSDSIFSVRVCLTLNLYRSNGTVKENTIDQSLFFEKQSSGKWLCYAMTAVDVSQPVGLVRLTFRYGDTVLSSDFYSTDASQLTCPIVSAPEGKIFSGWTAEEQDGEGKTVLRLVFQLDESGIVTLPADTSLEPMTLYPLFEDT